MFTPNDRAVDGPPAQSVRVEAWNGGGLVTVKARMRLSGERAGGGAAGPRATVQSFDSIRRLGHLLERLDRAKVPVLVALTLPSWGQMPPAELGAALKLLRRRFLRAFPDGGAVLRREHHKDGRPHFHGLFWTGTPGAEIKTNVLSIRRWLVAAWPAVLGLDVARVQAESPKDLTKVRAYVSGYLRRSKGYQHDARGVDWGWWWTTWGKLPMAELQTVEAADLDRPHAVYWQTVRALRRAGYIRRRRPGQLTVNALVDDPAQWARMVAILAEQGRSGSSTGSSTGSSPGSPTGAHQDVTRTSPVGAHPLPRSRAS